MKTFGLLLVLLSVGCAARAPMRVGRTYEVTWVCGAGGCSVELVTVAGRSHGWIVDTHGYWFKPETPLFFRPAVPLAPRQPSGPVRADDIDPPITIGSLNGLLDRLERGQ